MILHVDSLYLSPYAMSVFVALHEKQLAFEMLPVDLEAGAQHAAAYTQVSVTRRVPTLVDGAFSLSESSAITEYLDEVYPDVPLYPADPKDRARARQVQAWLRSDLLAIRKERSTDVVFRAGAVQALSDAATQAAQKLFAAALQLLGDGGAEHLFARWSIADVDLALMLNRLVLAEDPVPPALAHYAQQQWQHPAVRRWLELPRPAVCPGI